MNENEFVRINTAAARFDFDKRTLEAIIRRAQETHDIPVIEWNGQKRVHYPSLLNYALTQLAAKL